MNKRGTNLYGRIYRDSNHAVTHFHTFYNQSMNLFVLMILSFGDFSNFEHRISKITVRDEEDHFILRALNLMYYVNTRYVLYIRIPPDTHYMCVHLAKYTPCTCRQLHVTPLHQQHEN